MDSYKVLFTKEELKKLCDQKRRLWNTPLEQARRTIHTINRSRRQKPYKYEIGEWADDPKNKTYMKIAREFKQREAERIKALREARLNKED